MTRWVADTSKQIATPAAPAAGEQSVYFKVDGQMYSLDSTGKERAITVPPLSFLNGSFEEVDTNGVPTGWTLVPAVGTVTVTTDEAQKVTGTRSLKVTIPNTDPDTSARYYSEPFTVPEGSTVTFSANILGSSSSGLTAQLEILSAASPTDPISLAPTSAVTPNPYFGPTTTWSPRSKTTPLIGHTQVRVGLSFAAPTGGTIWVDAITVQVTPISYSQIMARGMQTFTGGGVRTVASTGHVKWSEHFMFDAASALVGGRMEMPPAATVIPVYSSNPAYTSATVTSAGVPLGVGDSLWCQMPVGGGYSVSNYRIIADTDDHPDYNERWVMVCHRASKALYPRSHEFRWGDGQVEDPVTNVSAFSNSWVNYGGSFVPASYYKVNGVFYCDFAIKSGTVGVTAFTVPDKPRYTATYQGPDGPFEVTAAGEVKPFTASNAVVRGSFQYKPAT